MIPLLQTIAPTLFKLIATKFGSIVTEKIKEKLEVSELPDKLSASDIAKLQELDKELALEFYRLDIDDRKSARKNNNKDSTPKVLAYIVTFGFFGILILYSYNFIPVEAETIMNIMIGSLGTAWVSIINYYFGSSLGSQRKTELILQPE